MAKKLLMPIADTIPVHVCWNNRHGNPTHLRAVEFTMDCEVCSVEGDCLEGDRVDVWNNGFAIEGDDIFYFTKMTKHVGNLMWDMVWMERDDVADLAEWLQKQRHWRCNCAATEIFNRWGKLTGAEFVEILERLSR